MKCPLLLPGSLHQLTKNKQEPLDCLQAECAWWHNGGDCCAVLSIAVNLTYIEESTAKVVNRDNR